MVRRTKDRKSAGSRDWRHRSQRRLRFETLEARELLSATTSVGSAAATRIGACLDGTACNHDDRDDHNVQDDDHDVHDGNHDDQFHVNGGCRYLQSGLFQRLRQGSRQCGQDGGLHCQFQSGNLYRAGDRLHQLQLHLGRGRRGLGKPASQINVTYDYDFAKLAAVENQLAGINRQAALRAIFTKVTAKATTDEGKQLALLLFLQEVSIHSDYLQPMYPNGTMVSDPLVLLQLGEMRCGQVARLAVDLFSAAGYQARVVQLGGHVIAEVYYGKNWHYFDADMFGGGQTVFNPDGSIPSVVQLSQSPYLIDSLAADWEPNSTNSWETSAAIAPSYWYFSVQAWDAQFPAGKAPAPYVLDKTATAAEAQNSIYYGWEYYKVVSTPDRKLYNMPVYYTPAAPQIESVETQRQADGSLTVTIGWNAVADPNGGVGYSILVSATSRGWNYDGQSLPTALMPWKSSNVPWNSSMYTARFTVPHSAVLLAQTTATSETFSLTIPGTYYVTVMPYDAHGASVGRTLYPESEELCFTV